MIFSINDVVKKYVVRDSKANFYCSVNQHLSSTNYYENVLWATPPFVKHSFVIFRWFHLFFLSFLSFFLPSQTLKFYCVSAACCCVAKASSNVFASQSEWVRSRLKRPRRLLWMKNNMLPANKYSLSVCVERETHSCANVAVCVSAECFFRLALSHRHRRKPTANVHTHSFTENFYNKWHFLGFMKRDGWWCYLALDVFLSCVCARWWFSRCVFFSCQILLLCSRS